jgi:hypothetical protein
LFYAAFLMPSLAHAESDAGRASSCHVPRMGNVIRLSSSNVLRPAGAIPVRRAYL